MENLRDACPYMVGGLLYTGVNLHFTPVVIAGQLFIIAVRNKYG